MNAQTITTLQKTHIAVWNEKDRTKRDALIQTIYAGDIKMYDKDFILTGPAAISDFIDKLFAGDPGFYFSFAKPMEAVQNGIRMFWNISTGGQHLTGMDLFILEDDKVAQLYVFMDAQPA